MMKKILFLFYLVVITISTNGQVQPRLVLPVGHTNHITSAIFSPDGKYVLTASFDKTARIWDASSGKEIHILKGHTSAINSSSFSSDGKYVVTASGDGIAIIWDVSSGKQLNVLKGHTRHISRGSFSADGKYIITSSGDGTSRIWEVASGKELHKLKGNTSKINSASFSSNGKLVVTGSDDSTARIWDVSTGKEFHKLQGHTGMVYAPSFSSDMKYILTASLDSTARIWDVFSGKELHNLKGHKSWISSASFSPDGKYVVTASADSTTRIWDVYSGKELHKLQGHTSWINSASFSSDGKFVVTASGDSTARLWDVSSGKEFYKFKGHTRGVLSACFSSDGKFLLTASDDRTVRIWEVSSGKELHNLHGSTIHNNTAPFSLDAKSVLTASEDGTVQVWDVSTGKQLQDFKGHAKEVYSAFFSSDGKFVVTASADSSTRIWDVSTGKELHKLQGHTDEHYESSFSSDGQYVLTISGDLTVGIWEVSSGKELHKLKGHTDGINSASFSSNGKYVVTSSWDSTVRIWDVSSGKELYKLIGHTSTVNSASFSSDDKYVISDSWDKTARIWEVSTGKEIYKLQGNKFTFDSTYFSSDVTSSVWFVSGDKTNKIFDVSSVKGLINFKGNVIELASAFFSENRYIITTGFDYKTILWDALTHKPLYTRLQLKNNDWLVYDEDNHFDGSEGAINYLYLTCGLEIIDLAQVKGSLWIPGLAGKIMRGEKLLINDKPAPKLSDLNICELTPIIEELPKDAKGNLIFQITPRNGGLGETEVYINDNLTYKFQPEQLTKTKNKEGKIIYLLNLSKDSITPFLSGSKGAINPVLVKCKIKGASIYSRGATLEMVTEKDPELPKLYAVFVGVNDYNNMQKESNEYFYKNLDYAGKDAGDLANMVEQSAHTLFKDSAFIYRLTGKDNIEPTKDNLKKVLTEIGTKAKANDILYIFFAGHGDIVKFKNDKTNEEKNEIRFMLQGADKRNKNTGGFGVEELTDWCAPKNIKAQKRVFVFDACHSGQFVNETMAYAQGGRGNEEDVRIRQLTSLKDKNGMMILAASSDDEYAYEDPSLNQGVLTYHLLEAVKDSKDSTLQVNKWFESTLDLVKEYATANNRKQTPETFGNGRFEIGNVNNQVRDSIKIGAPKARVGISMFSDPIGDADKKYPNLEKLVNDHYKQSGSRGDFISATTNEKAYYAKGSVLLDNSKLKVRYTLFYGDTPIAEPFSMPELKGLSEEEVVKKIIASMEGGINEYIKKSKK